MGDSPLPLNVAQDMAQYVSTGGRRHVTVASTSYIAPYRDVDLSPSSGSSGGCAPLVFLLVLIVALTAGFVVYAVITSNEINDLRDDVKQLKALYEPLSQSVANAGQQQQQQQRQPLRLDAIVQRREVPVPNPSVAPKAVAPSKVPVAERPQWATELKPRWLQFETPLDDAVARLPPDGGHKGLAVAGANGFKIECNIGGSVMQPTRDQVDLTFFTNDETGDEYAMVRVPGAAFRGRDCALEWMAQ